MSPLKRTSTRHALAVLAASLLAAAPATALESRAAAYDPDQVVPWARPGYVRPPHMQADFFPPGPAAKPETGAVRALPYPFAHAVGVSADADMSSLRTVEMFERLITRKYALNLGQSLFFHGFGTGVDGRPGAMMFADDTPVPVRIDAQLPDESLRTDQKLLRLMYGGTFDFVHSFSDDASLPVALVEELAATIGPEGSGSAAHEVKRSRQRVLNPSTGVHFVVDCDPGVRWVQLELEDQAGRRYDLDPFDGGPARGRRHVTRHWSRIVTAYPERRTFEHRSDACVRVRLSVEGAPGARARLVGLRMLSIDRTMVKRQLEVLRSLKLTPWICIRHGGFTGQSGHSVKLPPSKGGTLERSRSFHYVLSPDDEMDCEQVWSGDDAATPFYHVDLLKNLLGVEVLDTFSSGIEVPGELRQLIAVEPTLDGTPFYRLQRISPKVVALEKLKLGLPGVSNDAVHSMGALVELALSRMRAAPAQAVILYTHYNGFVCPKAPVAPTPEFPCHPNAIKGFELLHLRHYDPFGDVAASDRVWVTKLPPLMRFALVRGQIEKHARIDFESSRVDITSWRDDVLGRVLPAPGLGCGELHGQTFYVRDSATARVTLDGQPLTCVKRNPPDSSGRPSVTLIDASFPLPVLGGIDPARRGTVESRDARLRLDGSKLVLTVDGADARVVWRPHRLDVTGTTCLRITYRKSNPASRLSVDLESAGVVHTVLREDGAPPTVEQGWTVPAQETADAVVEFADISMPAKGCKRIPGGPLASLSFSIANARPGDTLDVERVELLRENPRPLHLAGSTVIVAGKLADGASGALVHLDAGGRSFVAVSDPDGYYLFPAVPRGAVAEVWTDRAGQRVHPAEGSAFLAASDRANLDL